MLGVAMQNLLHHFNDKFVLSRFMYFDDGNDIIFPNRTDNRTNASFVLHHNTCIISNFLYFVLIQYLYHTIGNSLQRNLQFIFDIFENYVNHFTCVSQTYALFAQMHIIKEVIKVFSEQIVSYVTNCVIFRKLRSFSAQ